jgi:hypothetical protein
MTVSRVFKSAVFAIAVIIVTATQLFAQQTNSPPTTDIAVRSELSRKLVEMLNIRTGAEQWRDMLLEPSALPACQCRTSSETQQQLIASWKNAVHETFDATAVATAIQVSLTRHVSADALSSSLEFYAEPALGRKISKIEKAQYLSRASDAEMGARIMRAQQSLTLNPSRTALLKAIIFEAQTVEATTNAFLNIPLATTMGSMVAFPMGYPRMDTAQLTTMIAARRPAVREFVSALALPAHAWLYGSLSDNELSTYLAELRAPHSKRIIPIVLEAFDRTMKQQALSIGAAFARKFTASRT